MTEKKLPKKNTIILLLIPPLLNYLDWPKDFYKSYFFLTDFISKRKEKFLHWQKEKKTDIIEFAEDLNELDFNSKVADVLRNITEKKIIFVNYPRTKRSLQIFEEKNRMAEQSQPVFLFVSFGEQASQIFTKLRNENIICPVCEKSWEKKETVEGEFFLCPNDKIVLTQEEAEKLTEYLLNDYVKKSIEIIEYQKEKKYKSITRELSIIDFKSPEILYKSLLEKINNI